MKLLVNASNLVVGGGLQVARSLVDKWSSTAGGLNLVVAASPQVAKILPDRVQTILVPIKPGHPVSGYRARRQLAQIENRERPDAVLSVFTPAYWQPKSSHICGFAWPWIDRHNPWPWRNLPFFRRIKQKLKIAYKLSALRKDDPSAFIVETEAVASCLERYFPGRPIHVVANNCGTPFFQKSHDASPGATPLLPQKAPNEFRIVILSQYYPHKHLEILPQVCSELKRRIGAQNFRIYLPLPVDGAPWKCIKAHARKLGVADSLVTIGPISPAAAPHFYRDADAMFLPTLLESFSANYPEAMISGVPIVTTDIPFARSICRDAALFFKPMDAADAAHRLCQLANDEALRETLRGRGFRRVKMFPDPDERAAAYLDIIRSTIENHQ
jgi:glycosyltransferase involved in cell wall biosynthesis